MEANFKVESFKDIRNYIHNYLGLTKDEVRGIVLEEIRAIVKEEISKLAKDEDFIHSYIEKEILRQLRYGELKHERRPFLINTIDSIYNQIDKTIHEEVCKRLRIELVEPEEEDGR